MQVFVKASRRAKAHTRQLGIIKKAAKRGSAMAQVTRVDRLTGKLWAHGHLYRGSLATSRKNLYNKLVDKRGSLIDTLHTKRRNGANAFSGAKVYARRPKHDLAIRANGAIMKIDRKIDLELTSGRGGQRRANQLARRRDAVIRFYDKSVHK